jgi:hypothetical protein
MMDSSRLNEIRAQRFAFLRAVYDETDGTTERMVQMSDIGAKVGFDDDLTGRIVTYLIDEGLLEWAAMGGLIELTHWGLKEVEEVLSTPEQPTEHFPSLIVAENVLNVGTMTHSQIQQGTTGSTQTLEIIDVPALRDLVADVRAVSASLELEVESTAELEAELATIDAQLGSPRPKSHVLRESLASARAILEGAAGGGLVAGAPQLAGVIERLTTAIASLPL